jgi:o-succinylbenzoate synthase
VTPPPAPNQALSDLVDSIAVVRLPLKTKFRGVTNRELMLFRGSKRWAEFSPFLEYDDAESALWLKAALDWSNNPQPEPVRKSIRVNATLPAVAATEVESVLSAFGAFETVKLKVAEAGQGLEQDLARIIEVRRLYPGARLRLDANGGLSVAQALALAEIIVRGDLAVEYLEQPVATLEEMVALKAELARRELPVPIAADELVRRASDPLAIARAGGADLLVLKAAPLGGVAQALKIAAEAKLPTVVSSAIESSVGLAMGLHLAATLPEARFDSGLATAALLAADVTREPLMPSGGAIELREVEPDPELLERYAVEPERRDWWLDRAARCLELL